MQEKICIVFTNCANHLKNESSDLPVLEQKTIFQNGQDVVYNCPYGIVTGFLKTEEPQSKILVTAVQFSLQTHTTDDRRKKGQMPQSISLPLPFITNTAFGRSRKALYRQSNVEGSSQGNCGFSPPQTLSEEYSMLQCVHVVLARRKGIKMQLFPCLLRFLVAYENKEKLTLIRHYQKLHYFADRGLNHLLPL